MRLVAAFHTILTCVALLGLAPAFAKAQSSTDDDDSYISYDSIVEDLTKRSGSNTEARTAASRRRMMASSTDPFDNIWIHAGVGMVQTTQGLALPNGQEAIMSGRGIQATLGIDILSPGVAAEGSMRSFGETEDQASRISLKEFDLKLVLKNRSLGGSTPSKLQLKAAAGLSARYMMVKTLTETYDLTTPASIVSLGGDLYFNDRMSVGLDISARNAVITDTFDKTSYDGTLRVDTHF